MSNTQISAVSKIATFFIQKFRITILLILSVLFVGYLSYTSLLKREGFPTVEIPIVIIQAPYFVNDIDKVDQEVVIPIESAIKDIQDINKITSTTTENFGVIIAELNEGSSSEEGRDEIQQKVESTVDLPESVNIEFQIVNASAVDGKHNMLFTISNTKLSVEELQEKAHVIAEEIEKNSKILEANAIDLITKEINPFTGEEFDYQKSLNRVGIRKRGEVDFYPAISIGVVKKDQYDALELSEAVKEEMKKLEDEKIINDTYVIEYTADDAETVIDQIESLESNALSGLIAVVVILFFFVNWRASLVVAIFIPTVMAASFIALYLVGYSLNVISLFALILVLGLLVDDAIVIVEAIDYQKNQGNSGVKGVIEAVNSVGAGDVAGTITTLLVFVPMAAISGILGEFIRLIPITVIITLILSLVIAITVVPLLSNILLKGRRRSSEGTGLVEVIKQISDFVFYGFSDFIGYAGRIFGKIVHTYLKYPLLALLVVIPLSIGLIWTGLYFSRELTFSIFPSPKDTDEMTVTVFIPNNDDIKKMEEVAIKVENVIKKEAEDYVRRVSYFESSNESTTMMIKLTEVGDRKKTSVEISEDIQDELDDLTEIHGAILKAGQLGVGPQGGDYQFAMQIFDEDTETLKNAGDRISNFLDERDLSEGEKITEVIVTDIATVSKIDGRRYAQVKAKISDPENTGLVLEIQEDVEDEFGTNDLKSMNLSEDALGFDFGQESENLESFESAGVSLVIALLVMYALLVLQFNSFSQPILIFLAIPLSFPGLFPGLYFTDNSLSFLVSIGIMSLIGIVVNNTIMLVEYANQAKKERRGIKYAISRAVALRFRPIVTTSATTIAGLLPLALSDPFWEGLSFSIIFGLISSSVLVLLVFPAYYGLFEYLRYIRDLAVYIVRRSNGLDQMFANFVKLFKYMGYTLFGARYRD